MSDACAGFRATPEVFRIRLPGPAPNLDYLVAKLGKEALLMAVGSACCLFSLDLEVFRVLAVFDCRSFDPVTFWTLLFFLCTLFCAPKWSNS
jgi:hypothetical protein